MGKKVDNSKAQYLLVERAFEILNKLKENTDETKTLTQAEILKIISTTKNARTLSSTIDKMLSALNPPEYDGENSDEFRIQYKGWDQNIMLKRLDLKEEKLEGKISTKLPSITDLRFVHDFTFDELDSVIEGIYFSKTINDGQRERLVKKIVNLSSKNYKSKYIDSNGKLRNNIEGIQENLFTKKSELTQNINIIQQAMKDNVKISFYFNGYNADKKLEPAKDKFGKNKEYVVSPYHIVAYNGKYYLIANTDPFKNVSIYRIDLMSAVNKKGMDTGNSKEIARRKPVRDIKGLSEPWDASAFISAHLNMFYDEPQTIRLKIRNDRYTILHDWFGERYEFKGKVD
ncbi:MAG TPA: WYL domain-containing protein, partial [Victivallales bacterium]|nr:WYL domain-containing protein [Victivallales bacterium]